MNDNGKDFFQSKSSWGAVVMLLVPILKSLGVTLDDGSQQALVEALTTLGGFAVLVWGQFTRNKPINSIAGIKVKSNEENQASVVSAPVSPDSVRAADGQQPAGSNQHV